MKVNFNGGINIAMKIPQRKYEETVTFYKEILKLEVEEHPITHPTIMRSCRVKFGPNTLWLDCCPHNSRSETWLELKTNDMAQATEYLAIHGITPCDELEEIPTDKHWITDPAGNVFILNK